MSYSSPFGWGGTFDWRNAEGRLDTIRVPNKIQGSALEPPGDKPGPSMDEVKMKNARDGLIVGGLAFLAAKYGFNSDTTKSLMVGAGAGLGTYMYLCNT